ncbi:MAG: Lysyl-tRNA synthetase [Acidobacteria bacterium]|nr:Lysyl-tRNA synthetase [Acidobacteriota bacterium]
MNQETRESETVTSKRIQFDWSRFPVHGFYLYNSRFTLREKILADQSIQDIIPDNDQTRARHEHLNSLRQLVGNVYPNKFTRSQVVEPGHEDTITAIGARFRAYEPTIAEGDKPTPEEIEKANQELNKVTVRLAGRIAAPPRVMGKAAFVHLSDGAGRLQVYVRKADVKAVNNDTGALIEEEGKGWELFGLLDHGDFIGAEGYLFVTRTGELSVHVQTLQFLAKALLPLPDKMHGINDPELRQRQRYVDLIAGSLKLDREEGELTPREVFERRSAIIRELRGYLEEHGYIEVETPMLTPLATGAAAKPFETYHNALGIPLYARIAPELYLKRLLVGGFEKVYELNRNFRNEGISSRHNPEFTMLEFYWAYADVNQMMDFCEEMIRTTVMKAVGDTKVRFGEHEFAFSQPFRRLSMREAIATSWRLRFQYCQSAVEIVDEWFDDGKRIAFLAQFLKLLGLASLDPVMEQAFIGAERQKYLNQEFAFAWENARTYQELTDSRGQQASAVAEDLLYLFEELAEPTLIQPTFIYDYPKPISPLSKASPTDPTVAERFELFIAGMEWANGFSELNDPAEQFQRFNDQVQQRERGDEEAMVMDEDYIRALSYGMPPAAGIGIGIDRFTMLLTNRQSIRDVILFPHLRPERKREETEDPPTSE